MTYAPGQRWTYKTRDPEPDSTILIGQVDRHWFRSNVIHISVDNVVLNGETIEVGHLPFEESAIDQSVVQQIESGVAVPDSLFEGVAIWKEQNGGVFTVSVAEVISIVNRISAFGRRSVTGKTDFSPI